MDMAPLLVRGFCAGPIRIQERVEYVSNSNQLQRHGISTNRQRRNQRKAREALRGLPSDHFGKGCGFRPSQTSGEGPVVSCGAACSASQWQHPHQPRPRKKSRPQNPPHRRQGCVQSARTATGRGDRAERIPKRTCEKGQARKILASATCGVVSFWFF